jgi:hypothetical protein
MTDQALRAFAERLAVMARSNETLTSTWNPPDWEDIVEWWNDAVNDARKLTGKTYRGAN